MLKGSSIICISHVYSQKASCFHIKHRHTPQQSDDRFLFSLQKEEAFKWLELLKIKRNETSTKGYCICCLGSNEDSWRYAKTSQLLWLMKFLDSELLTDSTITILKACMLQKRSVLYVTGKILGSL